MTWFYTETLDNERLVSALRDTLGFYPILCGRYDGASPPKGIVLSNVGVPVTLVTESATTLESAIAHLPPKGAAAPSIFSRDVHEPYVPKKANMDPDSGNPDAPLLAVKITNFEVGGGTAIGLLVQHGVFDGEAEVRFVTHWAQSYRGLELAPPPVHTRCFVEPSATAAVPDGPPPAGFKVRALVAGEQAPPEFLPVMPMINGPMVCAVPLSQATLAAWKADASAALPTAPVGAVAEAAPHGDGAAGDGAGDGAAAFGSFVSTDDVLSARVWKAMCRMRLAQVGLPEDCEEVTALGRAVNFRQRTTPPLGAGYVGNAAASVTTELTVKELLTLPVAEVAAKLRAAVQAHGAPDIATRAAWLSTVFRRGARARPVFDRHALTFIISSWQFPWEDCHFGEGARPVAYDHGALTPIVAVITSMPKAEGVLVYTSGPKESLEAFATDVCS
jgi:hypothetical protein